MDRTYWIYKITNNINGKVYIGQSVNYKKRWNEHKNCAKNGYDSHLYFAMRKYGIENFTFKVIDFVESKEQADYKEGFYASYYDSYNKNKGYNEQICGICKYHSDRTKEKISISRRKYKGKYGTFYGKKHTDETKRKISEKLKRRSLDPNYKNAFYGKKHTDKSRKIMSEKAKEHSAGEKNNMYGKHHTESTKEKMREKWTDERKDKLIKSQSKSCKCIETGEIFKSYKEAAMFIGSVPSAVTRAIQKGYSVNGYHFVSVEDNL